MISRGQIAAKVRAHKDANPALYCEIPACLWRVKHSGGPDTPCRKHPKPLPQIPMDFAPETCQDCGAPFNNGNPTRSGKCAACEA